jgi:hypothetical protein
MVKIEGVKKLIFSLPLHTILVAFQYSILKEKSILYKFQLFFTDSYENRHLTLLYLRVVTVIF